MDLFGSLVDSVKKISSSTLSASFSSTQLIPIGSTTYRLLDQLGEGGYAFVYRAEHAETHQQFAIKKIIAQDADNHKSAEMEITVLKQMQGKPYMLEYKGACKREIHQASRGTEYFILMEFCSNGSLVDLIKSQHHQPFSETVLCELFRQLCVAVSHLHNAPTPITHRDLKIENVLLTDGLQVRLCDFGSCITTSSLHSTRAEMTFAEERISKYSTSFYRAPEMVDLYKKETLTTKVDIWALGCILFTMAFFTHPFQEAGNLAIINGKYDIPEHHPYSKSLITLLKRLFTVNSVKRPDINKVLEMVHLWQQDLKDNPDGVKMKMSSKAKSEKKTNETRKSTVKSHRHQTTDVAVDSSFANDWNPFPDDSTYHAFPATSSSAFTLPSPAPTQPSPTATAQLFDMSFTLSATHCTQPSPHSSRYSPTIQPVNGNEVNVDAAWADFEQPSSYVVDEQFHGLQSARSSNAAEVSNVANVSVFDSFNWSLVSASSPKSNQHPINNNMKLLQVDKVTAALSVNNHSASSEDDGKSEDASESEETTSTQQHGAVRSQNVR